MIRQQQVRYDKIYIEEFYLLNFDQNDLIFNISGSTKNIYKIKWFTKDKEQKKRSFYCDCPDMKNHAMKANVYCKHICFIYKKIGCFDDLNFYGNKFLTDDQENKLMSKLLVLLASICDNSIQNKNLIDKFNKLLDNESNPNICMFENNIANKDISDSDCPICFDEFKDKDYLFCQTCGNVVHKKCIEKWLTKYDTCIYCRSDIWKKYKENMQLGGNIYRKL